MSVSVFEHGRPGQCPAGHLLTRGRFRVSFAMCACPAALAQLDRDPPHPAGHAVLTCKTCGDGPEAWRYYDPPHEPAAPQPSSPPSAR